MHPTNGYHVGWLLLCSALSRLVGSNATPEDLALLPRAALSLQLIVGIGAFAVLAMGLRREHGRVASTVVWIGAASPWSLYTMTDGMESGLAVAAVCLLLASGLRYGLLRSSAVPSILSVSRKDGRYIGASCTPRGPDAAGS